MILDKPTGMTSTQAVGAVRRIFDAQKAGHAGTLDPLGHRHPGDRAGRRLRTWDNVLRLLVQDSTKCYRFTARWGEARDTDDSEGKVTGTSDARPAQAQIEAMLPRFYGIAFPGAPRPIPAIKVDGERAYDLARDEDRR